MPLIVHHQTCASDDLLELTKEVQQQLECSLACPHLSYCSVSVVLKEHGSDQI